MRKLFVANVNVGRGVCAAYLKIIAISLGKLRTLYRLYVKARAAKIIVSAVTSVVCVPRMREIDTDAVASRYIGSIFYEQPILVQIQNISHSISPFLYLL